MPTSVILAAVAYGASAAAVSVGLVVAGGIGATLVGVAAASVVGSAIARRQERAAAQQAKAQAIANLKDVQSVIRSAVAPQNIIYGRALVGGVVTCWFTNGDVGQYHHWAQVLAAHTIDGVDAYYIGDQQVSVDGSGYVTTAQYCKADGTKLIRIRLYTGTQTTLDADLLAASAGALLSSDAGQGKAYLVVQFEADYDVFGQTGAPNIRAVVRGKKLYDPRTGLTAFSDNPALAVRDYLLADYGLRCTSTEVHNADIIAAANVCDESVALVSGSQSRYTANGAVTTASNLKGNLENLVDAMAGLAVWSQGQWRVKAGAYETPTTTIGVADILQVEDLIAYTPRRELFNTVTGTFIDPATLYAEKQFPLVSNATYVAADGAQAIERQLALPMCNDATRAQRMAKIEIERARQAVTVTLLCKWTTYDLTPGDHVSLTISRYGWAAKVFFVAMREISPDGIRYVLRETAAAVWAWNYGEATTVDLAPNTSLPNPYTVPTIAGLSAQSGTDVLLRNSDGTIITRMLVSWTAVASQYVQNGGRIELQYLPAGASVWLSQKADGDATSAYLMGVNDGAVYQVRARAINSMGQRGAWTTISHTVLGKTAPPASVESLIIAGNVLGWPAVADADLAGYRIKFQYGSNLEWGTAAAMHKGLVTASPYTLSVVPPGSVTIMVRAVDTSGNESPASAYVMTNLGNTPVANVLESIDYKAATWPGVYTGATVSGGNLVATQNDPFFGAELSNFYQQDTNNFYNTNFDAMNWVSTGYTPSLAATGSNMTIAWSLAGQVPTVQYRKTGPLPFFGNDASYFYGDALSSFYTGASAWETWPGILVASNQEYQFQINSGAGNLQGILSGFTVSVDVPDKNIKLNNQSISASGSRLTGAIGQFNVIQNIQLTLQGGNTAVALEITDKSATLGPLITAKNSAGTSVAATIDALLQGY